jgi:hypothetical protein
MLIPVGTLITAAENKNFLKDKLRNLDFIRNTMQ